MSNIEALKIVLKEYIVIVAAVISMLLFAASPFIIPTALAVFISIDWGIYALLIELGLVVFLIIILKFINDVQYVKNHE